MLLYIPIIFAVACLIFGLAINLQRKSTAKFIGPLTHNCLLTRFPIVFISGKKSPFYFLHYWNYLPSFLAEHGYEVYKLNLPWKNRAKRLAAIEKDLLVLGHKGHQAHLVVDNSTSSEIIELLQNTGSTLQICSITCLSQPEFELNFGNSLSGLPVPIELLEIEASSPSPYWWPFHLILTRQSNSLRPHILGLHDLSELRTALLNRVRTLAERDLLKTP